MLDTSSPNFTNLPFFKRYKITFALFQVNCPDPSVRSSKVAAAVVDTVVWQGLASVAIPGFTINRICWASGKLLQAATSLPTPARRWAVTAIGLGSIPFIIKPIDHSVDYMLDNSLRRIYGIQSISPELDQQS